MGLFGRRKDNKTASGLTATNTLDGFTIDRSFDSVLPGEAPPVERPRLTRCGSSRRHRNNSFGAERSSENVEVIMKN